MCSRNNRLDFLLDTNIISALMRDDPKLGVWLASEPPETRLLSCTIVRGQILVGLAQLPEGRRRTDLESKAYRLLDAIPCEPVPVPAAVHYARIKAAQQRKGLSLDENDLWIAATAVALGATLVSRDRDFQRLESFPLISP
jgi:predicted nucleic acid-binding protein